MASLEELRHRLDATAWLGVGIFGCLVFLVGVYEPAFRHLPDAQYLQVAVAIAGGATAVLGLSFWWDSREEDRLHPKAPPLRGRAREVAIAPSLEIYRPGEVVRPPREGEGDPEDPSA